MKRIGIGNGKNIAGRNIIPVLKNSCFDEAAILKKCAILTNKLSQRNSYSEKNGILKK